MPPKKKPEPKPVKLTTDEQRLIDAAYTDINFQSMHPFAAQTVHETIQRLLTGLGKSAAAEEWLRLHTS